MTTQTNQILTHLQTVGHITGVEAAALYRSRCLPRRIADLREQGYRIKSIPKRDITGQRYVRYEMD
jgi:hypothetical protein